MVFVCLFEFCSAFFFLLSPFFIQSHFMVLSCIRYLTRCCFTENSLGLTICSFFMTDDSQNSDLYSHYIITCKISIYEGYNGYTKSWSSLKRAHLIEWENAYNLLVTLLGWIFLDIWFLREMYSLYRHPYYIFTLYIYVFVFYLRKI